MEPTHVAIMLNTNFNFDKDIAYVLILCSCIETEPYNVIFVDRIEKLGKHLKLLSPRGSRVFSITSRSVLGTNAPLK